MNNLSTPSRVILSNPTRVILSVAKDLAVAFALFAFAACSDYLEDFQDKYDDGNAFAEISSDSDNDDRAIAMALILLTVRVVPAVKNVKFSARAEPLFMITKCKEN